mgnify:CR=1 FL=1
MSRYYDNYENTIEWLKDDGTATLSLTQRRTITKIENWRSNILTSVK